MQRVRPLRPKRWVRRVRPPCEGCSQFLRPRQNFWRGLLHIVCKSLKPGCPRFTPTASWQVYCSTSCAQTCFQHRIKTISCLPHFLSWAILIMINWLGKGGIVNEFLLRLGLLPFRLKKEQAVWRNSTKKSLRFMMGEIGCILQTKK